MAQFECPKCGNHTYDTGEIRAAGGFWSKIFDIQAEKFTTVICERCRYTELFKADSGSLENIFDLFTQ